MFGCSSEATASVSRRKRSRKAASWFGGRGVSGSSTFTATWRRGRDCCARNTAPIPPCPITCWRVHVPSTVPINASAFIKTRYLFSGCDVSWLVATQRAATLPPVARSLGFEIYLYADFTGLLQHLRQLERFWQCFRLGGMTKVMSTIAINEDSTPLLLHF